MFVKFSNFMSRGWGFDSLFYPEGRVFVHNDCPGGVFLLPSSRVPGVCPGGMVMDEIDTCIELKMIICLLLDSSDIRRYLSSSEIRGFIRQRMLPLHIYSSKRQI